MEPGPLLFFPFLRPPERPESYGPGRTLDTGGNWRTRQGVQCPGDSIPGHSYGAGRGGSVVLLPRPWTRPVHRVPPVSRRDRTTEEFPVCRLERFPFLVGPSRWTWLSRPASGPRESEVSNG